MRTTDCFERALFYEQSPAADQFYEGRLRTLFELQDAGSSIEIHIQWPLHSQISSGLVHSDDEASCHSDDDTEYGSKPDTPLMKPPSQINSRKEDPTPLMEPPSQISSHKEVCPPSEEPSTLFLHKIFTRDELRKMEYVRSSAIPRYAKSDQGQREGFKTTYPDMVCA